MTTWPMVAKIWLAALLGAGGLALPVSATPLVAKGAIWRYLDTGAEPGSVWQALDFEDSAWQSAPAELGYGDGDEATVVGFGGKTSVRYITTWFRHTFTLADATAWQALTVRLKRDDGAAVYLNGIEVMRSNLPAGALTSTTLATAAIDDSLYHEFAIDPTLLATGANVLAVEVHQASVSSSDISFDLELDGTSGTAAPTQALVAKKAAWKYLDTGSHPGSAWPTASFDDGLWNSGAAELGYGDGGEATLVGFGGNASARHVTTWFRHSFTLADPAAIGALALAVKRDDGVAVYVNGTEILRDNLPIASLNAGTLAISAVEDESWHATAVPPALLVAGVNVVAAEIHQASASSSDISFDLELVATLSPGPAGCTDAAACDDGNACTIDSCNAGQCLHAHADGTPCSTSPCSTGDSCQGGSCAAGTPLDCSDDNVCTTDACAPGNGACVHTAIAGCGGVTTFQRTYGGMGDDKGTFVRATADGGFLLGSRTDSFGAGSTDMYVVKVDACGERLWQRTYGGTGADALVYIAAASDGGFLLVGESRTWAGAYLVRIDAVGKLRWSGSYGGGGYDQGLAAVQTADGGFVAIAESWSLGPGVTTTAKHNNHIFKVDDTGKLLWSNVYGGEVMGDAPAAIIEVRDAAGQPGGLLVAGSVESWGKGSDDIWLLRLDGQGNLLWSVAHGTEFDDESRALIQTQDGGFAIAGNTRGGGAAWRDAFLLKLGADGQLQWMRRYGSPKDDEGMAVHEVADGFVVGGLVGALGAGSTDYALFKTNTSGQLQWYRTYGGSGGDFGLSLDKAADGGWALGGYSHTFRIGGARDFYLVKTGPNGESGCKTLDIDLASVGQASIASAPISFTPSWGTGAVRSYSATKVGTPSGTGLTLCGCQ